MKSTPVFSYRKYLISVRNQPIDRMDKVAGMPTLVIGYRISFDGSPTLECAVVKRHKNPVLRKERGEGGSVVLVECLVILQKHRTNLLGYFRIDRVFLLGKGRQSKADCKSCKANY
jgi:hypothetical protein